MDVVTAPAEAFDEVAGFDVPHSSVEVADELNVAWRTLATWERPTLTLYSDGDPITAGGERVFQSIVPGAEGQPHRTIEGAGHFPQEDAGPLLADTMAAWMR